MWRMMLLPILASLALLACGGDDTSDDGSLALWAAKICSVAEKMASMEDVGGDVDPTSLSVDARKDRSVGLSEVLVSILDEVLASAEAIEPPGAVRSYQMALIEQARALRDAVLSGDAKIANAESHEEIEAVNAETNIVLERTERDVSDAAENLPDEATAALRGVRNCGNITG